MGPYCIKRHGKAWELGYGLVLTQENFTRSDFTPAVTAAGKPTMEKRSLFCTLAVAERRFSWRALRVALTFVPPWPAPLFPGPVRAAGQPVRPPGGALRRAAGACRASRAVWGCGAVTSASGAVRSAVAPVTLTGSACVVPAACSRLQPPAHERDVFGPTEGYKIKNTANGLKDFYMV